jgi:hypothetical protein
MAVKYLGKMFYKIGPKSFRKLKSLLRLIHLALGNGTHKVPISLGF